MNEKRISMDPDFTDEEYLALMVGTEEELEQEWMEAREEELQETNLLEGVEKELTTA